MPSSKLIALLRSPENIAEVADADWNDIVEQGRSTHLLGPLAARLDRAQLLGKVPAAVRRHLDLAVLTSTRRAQSALWEIATVRRSIDSAIPLVLLKGCAYAACGDEIAMGRVFSDIDMLVRRENLTGVEAVLFASGWKPSPVNRYDLAFYRNWMHEVPPMEHVRRHTVVDLHHAINPPVSRYFIDPEKLLQRCVEVDKGVFVLDATDRVIHCALHLLQEGDPKKLVRDLHDLSFLIRQHHGSDAAMEQLRLRARELRVDAVLEPAIGAAMTLFGPDRGHGRGGWLQISVDRAARESGEGTTIAGVLAAFTVLAHSHWMKMPMHLLVPHLLRKSITRVPVDKVGRP